MNTDIVLYGRTDCSETRGAAHKLCRFGYTFTMENASRADVVLSLQHRLNQFVDLPGILLGGKHWIDATDTNPEFPNQIQEYVANTAALQSESELHPGQRSVELPNGLVMTVEDLTKRLLMQHTTPTFTGSQAVRLYKRLYSVTSDEEAVVMGHTLMDFGILAVVNSAMSFDDSTFQLQAKIALNTFLLWPDSSIASINESWKMLSNLSRAMGEILETSHSDDRRNVLVERFELDVCALQSTALCERMDYIVKLYNLMVNHYSLKHMLPSALPDLLKVQEKIGYVIDGRLVTAASLRNLMLLESMDSSRLPSFGTMMSVGVNESKPRRWWQRSFLRCRRSSAASLDNVEDSPFSYFFRSAFIRTYRRSIFLMVWDSQTTYPPVCEDLDEATSGFCERNVRVSQDPDSGSLTVWLPPLLSWFRHEFGTLPESVLEVLLPYMPQLRNRLLKAHDVSVLFNVPPRDANAIPIGLLMDDERTSTGIHFEDGNWDDAVTGIDSQTMEPMSLLGDSFISGYSMSGIKSSIPLAPSTDTTLDDSTDGDDSGDSGSAKK